jgi:hypothetical protein
MPKLKIYTTYEAQKQEELEDNLHLSPIERIKQVVDLIRKIYTLKTKEDGKKLWKITFVKT